MPSSSLSISLKNLRGLFQQNSPASRDYSAVAGILTVSKPVLAFGSSHCLLSPLGPRESTTISTVYRNASDAAQTFLPPLQGVTNAIPVVGGIIKAVIGGMLSTLQLVDRYIQNEDDMVQLTTRLHLLLRLIDIAPIPRTTEEENMRWWLLCALQTEQSKLEKMRKRIRGSSSVTQDITGCISRTNNHLLDYMIFAHMVSQNELHEINVNTNRIARFESVLKQVQFIENFMGTAGTGSLPASPSLGYVTLVDATGREHPMLLDQCRNLDQLDLMLHASLHQCRPDEAKIQRWYIERGQYDFVIYKTDLDVIQLTKECNIWSTIEPGTTIVMRAIIEEETGWEVTARYKCPCGTPNTINVGVKDLSDALQRGCTIICGHCERRFQITRARGQQESEDSTDNQRAVGSTPAVEEKYLIRNFLAKQLSSSPDFATLCSNYLTMLSQKLGDDGANDVTLADAASVAAATDATDAEAIRALMDVLNFTPELMFSDPNEYLVSPLIDSPVLTTLLSDPTCTLMGDFGNDSSGEFPSLFGGFNDPAYQATKPQQ